MLPKISGVEVTPSVTTVESSEQFWRKIRQIWRICEPCLYVLPLIFISVLFNNIEVYYLTGLYQNLNITMKGSINLHFIFDTT